VVVGHHRVDAPIVEPADAPAPDVRPRADAPADAAAPDAPPPDAPPPDAEPDPCPTRSRELTLGSIQTGQLTGASTYEPTCSAGASSGPEDFYHVDVAGASSADLVVDVVDTDPGLDTILDVTGSCMGFPGAGLCASVGGPGAGEVVVVPFVSTSRSYIVVDSVAGSHGGYTVQAFLRAVVAKGATCSPGLTTSRCRLGEYCVDLDDDGVAKCEDLSTVADTGINDDPCAAANNNVYRLSADAAYLGSLDDANDVDVVELDPTANAMLRVVVDDGGGGCGVDTVLDLLTGTECGNTSLVVSDDNSGLGPCPQLDGVPLVGGQRYWLRVRAAAGAPVKKGAIYAMVIDFVYAR